jgi:hypothetical protein
VKRFRAVAREVGYAFESEKALRGAGDIGDIGAVEVDYGDAPPDGVVPGKFLAVEEDQSDNQIVVNYYYDDDEPESVTLFRDERRSKLGAAAMYRKSSYPSKWTRPRENGYFYGSPARSD